MSAGDIRSGPDKVKAIASDLMEQDTSIPFNENSFFIYALITCSDNTMYEVLVIYIYKG